MALWNRVFGELAGAGQCACCRRTITQQGFECGHVIPVAKGGTDALENLRPICTLCNRSMGANHMDEWCKATGVRAPLSSFCVDV